MSRYVQTDESGPLAASGTMFRFTVDNSTFFLLCLYDIAGMACIIYNIQTLYGMKNGFDNFRKMLAVAMTGSLVACGSGSGLEGTWVEPVPGMENMDQGFRLDANGKASSVNMATLRYETWKQEGDRLILTGESIGNGITVPFSDTLKVEKVTEDSLIVKKKALTLRYSRMVSSQSGESVPMAELTPAKKMSFRTEGTLVLGHETRSFTPEGETEAYWIIDKTGRLAEEYDGLTEGTKNGTPVHADLEVIDAGKSDEGFARSYRSVYQVVKINSLSPAEE